MRSVDRPRAGARAPHQVERGKWRRRGQAGEMVLHSGHCGVEPRLVLKAEFYALKELGPPSKRAPAPAPAPAPTSAIKTIDSAGLPPFVPNAVFPFGASIPKLSPLQRTATRSPNAAAPGGRSPDRPARRRRRSPSFEGEIRAARPAKRQRRNDVLD